MNTPTSIAPPPHASEQRVPGIAASPLISSRYVGCIRAAESELRRTLARRSPLDFARVYLASHFPLEPSRMHNELNASLVLMDKTPGSHLAIAAPRGHAKSTIVSLAFVLYRMLLHNEPFTLIASATEALSSQLVKHVREQLESNPLLLADFPDQIGTKRVSPWRKGSLKLPSGQMLMGCSTTSNIRGLRVMQHRPSLIIADDLEDKQFVTSEDYRAKLSEWFNGTLLKVGTPDTRVAVVGTLMHPLSLLAGLLSGPSSSGWTRRIYKAVESFSDRPDLWDRWTRILAGTEVYQGLERGQGAAAFLESHRTEMLKGVKVLWPQRFTYEALMTAIAREGKAAFRAEYQNEPVDPNTSVFANAKISFWDELGGSPLTMLPKVGGRLGSAADRLGFGGEFFGACDPGMGRVNGDYSAIVILFRPSGSQQMYVVVADIERRLPNDTILRIVEYLKTYPCTTFAFESNMFQGMLLTELKRMADLDSPRTSIVPIENRTNKVVRIASLEIPISQGLLVCSQRHHGVLLEQLTGFPNAKHDDGPDALEMAVQAVKLGSRKPFWINT